jgi:NAD(P)-dependent dehydrogenase (short-subunit alcohol dehydrogenase family)
MPKLNALDYLAMTALSSVAGWAYACTKGKRSAMISTAVFTTVYGALYLTSPARKFPSSEEVTEGVDLTDNIAFVTGATSGIGIETARVLALRGAHVYLAARNEEKLQATKDQLLKDNPEFKIDILVCDLSDLDSVKSCAASFLKQQDKLDILINNAGIMAVPNRQETKQGLESQVGVCHVGHFYLTSLLLPAVEKSKNGRVVCLSSSAQAMHQFDKCLQSEMLETEPYHEWTAYGNAKVANLLHAKGLSNKGISAYAVMPGGIMTGLQANIGWWAWLKFKVAEPLFFKTVNQGAATSLLCATNIDVPQIGEYHDNCKPAPQVLEKVLEQVGDDAPEQTYKATEQLLKRLGFS